MYGTSKVSHGLAATQGSRADELKKRLVVTEEERRRGPRLDYIHSVALAVSGVSHMQRVACIIYSLRRGRAMHMEWPCGAWFEELGVCETNFQELMWVAPFFTGFCRPVSNERHETKTVRPFHSHQEEGHEPKKPLRRSVRVSGETNGCCVSVFAGPRSELFQTLGSPTRTASATGSIQKFMRKVKAFCLFEFDMPFR